MTDQERKHNQGEEELLPTLPPAEEELGAVGVLGTTSEDEKPAEENSVAAEPSMLSEIRYIELDLADENDFVTKFEAAAGWGNFTSSHSAALFRVTRVGMSPATLVLVKRHGRATDEVQGAFAMNLTRLVGELNAIEKTTPYVFTYEAGPPLALDGSINDYVSNEQIKQIGDFLNYLQVWAVNIAPHKIDRMISSEISRQLGVRHRTVRDLPEAYAVLQELLS